MAATVEVRKGQTVRTMSEYSFMLLTPDKDNNTRGGWTYIRHITGDSEGFDPMGDLRKALPGTSTISMATPYVPEEVTRMKTRQQGSSGKAVAIDPNAGAETVIDTENPEEEGKEGSEVIIDPNQGSDEIKPGANNSSGPDIIGTSSATTAEPTKPAAVDGSVAGAASATTAKPANVIDPNINKPAANVEKPKSNRAKTSEQ